MKRVSLSESCCISLMMEEWLLTYKVKNTAPRTVENYRFAIGKFIGVIGDIVVSKIATKHVDLFKAHLIEKNLHIPSINSYLRSLRVFINWLGEHGYIKPIRITLIKYDREPIESYTDAELKLLLAKPSKRHFSEYRNWVAINFLIGTGCRRHTLLNVKVSDLDFQGQTILLRITKSRKPQMIPMTHSLAVVLKEFINSRKAADDDYLICSAFGKQLPENGFTHEIQKYNLRRGVTKTSVHLFRHTFARMYLQAGGNVVHLSKILGHRDISTTMIYISLFIDDLKSGFDKLCPLDQIRSKA